MKQAKGISLVGGVFSLLVAVVLLTPGSWGCAGGGGESGGGGGDDGGGGGGGGVSANALAVAYPSDLAVTSLTANSSGSAGLGVGLKSQEDLEEVAPPTFGERREEMQGILNAENPADLASRMEFDFSKGLPPVSGCFGPNIYLSQSGGMGHPDGPIGTPENSAQMLPPKDVGIYEITEDGQACIAEQMNKLIAQIDSYLRVALEGTAFTLAAGNLAGETLPAQGETRDLLNDVTDVVEAAGDAPPIDFESATLSREAEDTGDGNPVYVTTIEGTVEMGPGEPPPPPPLVLKAQEEEGTTATVEIRLNHISTAGDNSTYAGRLVQEVLTVTDEVNPNLVGCDGMTECLSITYEKDSETELLYHMRRAQFCGQNVNCFDGNGDVTRDTAVWASEYYYVTCSVNPVDGSGDCYQAWQAGRNDGNTRTFNVSVNPDGTGRGYFGYGPAIDASEGAISGMICNWTAPGAGPFGNKLMVEKAQQQNFALNSMSGLYEHVGAKILYAPQNDCNKAAGGYAFGNEDPPMDHPVGEAFDNDLIDVAGIVFAPPGLPVVPATPWL